MSKIFISHSHRDSETAREIATSKRGLSSTARTGFTRRHSYKRWHLFQGPAIPCPRRQAVSGRYVIYAGD
jgi:hypothetical protein